MTRQTKITSTSILFLTIFLADVWAVATKHISIEMIFKPLLMTSLVTIYLVSVKKPNFWYISALFFSFWGDVLLLFKEQFFVFGLAAFLVAHIFYIKITAGFLKKVTITKILISSVSFVMFFGVLISFIYPNLAGMKIPVIVYGITISSFGAITLLNYITQKSTENLWLFLGTVIFIVSDSMIALGRFYEAKEIYGTSIMLTYVVAQYLICKSMIVNNNKA